MATYPWRAARSWHRGRRCYAGVPFRCGNGGVLAQAQPRGLRGREYSPSVPRPHAADGTERDCQIRQREGRQCPHLVGGAPGGLAEPPPGPLNAATLRSKGFFKDPNAKNKGIVAANRDPSIGARESVGWVKRMRNPPQERGGSFQIGGFRIRFTHPTL